ncbi:5-methylcytosine-specific restriction endonuclease system specificity protein McrC [Gilliamella sp. ESL0441]|uniref:5-methylcytosine restriction system specificity protein McrC n=1 Tax=Gilliamella sp. ESL0441 TaxID=2704654 RepID=UPI001C69DB0A|nr:5-methylcytosine-specific restriction endonuclease system specificity protein McrC [Gilliamella sp. ESL0441]QYN45444.1 5-methylcytosine-specific restriction endonuclease system specificity protein McrC [Gilliamella sp. ESL0441]
MNTKSTIKQNITLNKIPIRNIWLLLLYASDSYKELDEHQRINFEENPEKIVELTAEIYCKAVHKGLRYSLSNSYQPEKQVLTRVRGKIDYLTTTRKLLLEKGKIHCRYDGLTNNTPKNQYIHGAAHVLLRQLNNDELIKQCKQITNRFKELKIGKSNYYNPVIDQFNRSNPHDNLLVSVAKLVHSLSIPTELFGKETLNTLEKTDQWLRALFEKAVIGFYRVNLNPNEWQIESGKRFKWQCTQSTDNIGQFMPEMITDLIIENNKTNSRLIVDTKCTSIFKKSSHSFITDHLYQLYAYVRSQEKIDDPLSFSASGMLLYPTVDESINEHTLIQGHQLNFSTIDLRQENMKIKDCLLSLLAQST